MGHFPRLVHGGSEQMTTRMDLRRLRTNNKDTASSRMLGADRSSSPAQTQNPLEFSTEHFCPAPKMHFSLLGNRKDRIWSRHPGKRFPLISAAPE